MGRWKKVTAAVFAAVIVLAGCGGGRYDAYRSLLRRELSLMRDFTTAAKRADTAVLMERALHQLNENLAILAEEARRFKNDHPDLASLSTPPAELQPDYDQLGLALRELDRALIMKEAFFKDPDVKAEVEKMVALQAELEF